MSCGARPAAVSDAGAEPKATPREREPPAVTRVKRACWRSVAHAGHVLDARRRERAGLGCGLPEPNGPQPLELLGELELQRAARHDRVHSLASGAGPRAQRGAGVRRQRAPEGLERLGPQLHAGRHPVTAEASRCAAHAPSPAWRS